MTPKKKAPRNRTIALTREEVNRLSGKLIILDKKANVASIVNKTINQDVFEAAEFLPDEFVDLLIVDPPYNLTKKFNTTSFKEKSIVEYADWIESFVLKLLHTLKPTASIYFCGDWKSSTSIHLVLSKYFKVNNRITWEREKGRGSTRNWKNNSEDIWFCSVSGKHVFNANAVKLKRKVIAPYRDEKGVPKDWKLEGENGYRLTYPSNIWCDISIPFWSMKENTEHPTQKPEKLIAKLILAGSKKGQIIFDPFLGSGTTAVTAKKLGRKYVGIEIDKHYACLAEKRLELADEDSSIQGYSDGVFWERNTHSETKNIKNK